MDMSMAKLPEILKKTVIARSRFFAVEELELEFSNGARRTYERLRPGSVPAVMVVAVHDDDTVLLIREYGAGVHAHELGLPKGTVEADETLEQGALRELQEEAGFGARKLRVLKTVTLSPGYMGHRLTIVLARDLYPSRLEGDEPEPIEVVPMPLAELEEWVWREDLTEARSIAALYLVRDIVRAERLAQVAGTDET